MSAQTLTLLPPCEHSVRMTTVTTACHPTNARSTTWQSSLSAPVLPKIEKVGLVQACNALRMQNVQEKVTQMAITRPALWSPWLTNGPSSNYSAPRMSERCLARVRSWRPRLCELSEVYITGAAQMMVNESSYFGPPQHVRAALRPFGRRRVQRRVEHAVLTRNEFGAGYYHFLFDTLASLAFLWPVVRHDLHAMLVLNPCSTGRDDASRGMLSLAPDLSDDCRPRPYAVALLEAMGIPMTRVVRWPYTRQREGPALFARKASFMCAHPWQSNFHRGFWYARQLRALLHGAFGFGIPTSTDHPRQSSGRLLVLVDRKKCADGCDPRRNVRGGSGSLLAALRTSFLRDNVLSFTGSEPIAHQARIFHDAALIAGPHGAAFANAVWCRDGTSLVEFHRLHRQEPNSPLYALLARILHLRYWLLMDTVSSPERHGYQIDAADLVSTVRAALDEQFTPLRDRTKTRHTIEYPNWMYHSEK